MNIHDNARLTPFGRERLVMQVLSGQGGALARTTLAAWDLLNGRLVRPFLTALPLSRRHSIVCPKAAAKLPKIAAFRDWVLAEAADDSCRLKTLAQVRTRLTGRA